MDINYGAMWLNLIINAILTFVTTTLFPILFYAIYPARISKTAFKYIYWIEAVASWVILMIFAMNAGLDTSSGNIYYMIFWYFICRSICGRVNNKKPENVPQQPRKAALISAVLLLFEFIVYVSIHGIFYMPD